MIAFLKRIHIAYFIAINVAVITGFNFIISNLSFLELFTRPEEILELQKNPIVFFIGVIIFAPIIETMVFQLFVLHGSHYLLSLIKHKNWIIPIILSSASFGLSHSYNLSYMFLGALIGLLFAISYIIALTRKEMAIVVVAIIHAFVNLFPFCKDFIF